MRIRAYDPYLQTRGGGERYFLELCSYLAEGHMVEVVPPIGEALSTVELSEIANTFGLAADRLATADWQRPAIGRWSTERMLSDSDLAVTVTNRYPLTVKARHVSVLQFPWGVTNWWPWQKAAARRSLATCDLVLTYSNYVRQWVERTLGYAPEVLYPSVSPVAPLPKEPIILSVGRLTAGGHNKKHGAMIAAFMKLRRRELSEWRLILAGSAHPSDEPYIRSLRNLADGAPVEILPNIKRADLESLFGRASIYWHATGYGERMERNPERFEHFGIAVVEAMSAGCTPVVFDGGGLPEIVQAGRSGVLWGDVAALVSETRRLALDGAARTALGLTAQDCANRFSAPVFRDTLTRYLTDRALI